MRDGTETVTMEARLATAGLKDGKMGKTPAFVQIEIGMKAMVLLNITTEAEVMRTPYTDYKSQGQTIEYVIIDIGKHLQDRSPTFPST